MVLFNYSTREITAKIVYYGPGLCGKTTNLQHIHAKMDQKTKGKLLSLATDTDRTLFFDFLPLDLGKISGFHVRYQLYTVPGQVHYNATRRMVLKGVDAVVFVADSQIAMADNNRDSFKNLFENLMENGYKPDEVPIVLQANKRDLPNVASQEDILEAMDAKGYQIFDAVANRGDGVLETLKAIVKLATAKLKDEFRGEGMKDAVVEEIAAAAPTEPPAAPSSPAGPQPLVGDDDGEFVSSAAELEFTEDDVRSTTAVPAEVAEFSHDEWEVLDEAEAPDAPPAVTSAKENPGNKSGKKPGRKAGKSEAEEKAVEEINLEEFEVGDASSGISAAGGGSEMELADLRSRVDELARGIELLQAENHEFRGMLEKIFLGFGRQIEVLGDMRKAFSDEEDL